MKNTNKIVMCQYEKEIGKETMYALTYISCLLEKNKEDKNLKELLDAWKSRNYFAFINSFKQLVIVDTHDCILYNKLLTSLYFQICNGLRLNDIVFPELCHFLDVNVTIAEKIEFINNSAFSHPYKLLANDSIIKLVDKLLDTHNEDKVGLFCLSGGASKYALKCKCKDNMHVYDYDDNQLIDLYKLALINDFNPCLVNDDLKNLNGYLFDRIVIECPHKYEKKYAQDDSYLSTPFHYVKKILSLLKENGRAVVIINSNSLIRPNNFERSIYNNVLFQFHTTKIINLPNNLTRGRFAKTIMVFENKKIERVDIVNEDEINVIQDKEGNILLTEDCINFIVSDMHSKECPQELIKHREEILSPIRNKCNSSNENIKFDYCLTSFNLSPKLLKNKRQGVCQALTASDVQDGYIDYDNLSYISEDMIVNLKRIEESDYLKAGDVLISNKSTTFKIAVITPSDKKILPIGYFIKLKTRNLTDAYYIASYLNSYLGQEALEELQSGSQNVKILSRSGLDRLSIPFSSLDEEIRIGNEYVEFISQVKAAKEKIENIKHKMGCLFNEK